MQHIQSYVVRYLKKYAMEKVYSPMVLTGWALPEHALLSQEVAFKELVKDEKEVSTCSVIVHPHYLMVVCRWRRRRQKRRS